MKYEDTSLENIISTMNEHGKCTPETEESICRAYNLCREAHASQVRLSGEPYYIHPVAVSLILAEMGMDSETVIAGLLHDVIEDTVYGYDEVKEMFGDDVALLVDGVTKLKKIQYVSREDQQVENLRKMFFAMAKDIRVILIKLADRLHNMRTIKFMSPEKQRIIAKETLDVFAPLAHRLGISQIKCELEDLSLRCLDSVAFYEIAESLDQKKAERDAYVKLIRDTIENKMTDMGIKSHINGRAKHIYSIFRKMYTQGKSIDEIYDLFAVRIIVDEVSDCYAALGMVHEQYKPIPGRFKDYIAMPKPNMYQSLHTTVIGPDGRPFEIQIRTWEMHRVAEQGIAAHWKYKEGASADDKKLAWVDKLLEVQKDAENDEDFMRTLKIDMFGDEVFVFTPKGNVISLPQGATPIDFAFYIHSAVGYRMTGAKANTRIVPLDYKLQNGDIVEILTSSAVKGPSRDWLKIVKTSQARNKINAWFKKENREVNIEKGREAIEREIKRLNYGNLNLLRQEFLEPMLRRYGFNTIDEMYAAVGYGGITSAKVVTRLRDIYGQLVKEEPSPEPAHIQKPKKRSGSGIEVEGIDNCLVRLSKCCSPVAGDDIIGFITRGRGVSVHRKDCINIQPEKLNDEMRSRMINCTWAEPEGNYSCELQIEGPDRGGMLGDVTNVISDVKVPLLAVNARTTKERMAVINITIEVNDKSQIDMLVKKLYRIPGVFEVHRN